MTEKSITGGEVEELKRMALNEFMKGRSSAELRIIAFDIISETFNILNKKGHLKTTGDSFEDRVRTALYPTGVKHPQQATTDNMIREIVMLVGLRLKTTGQDEKEVDLDALKRFPVWLSEADKVEWDSKCDRYNQGWNACIDHLASTGRIRGVETPTTNEQE